MPRPKKPKRVGPRPPYRDEIELSSETREYLLDQLEIRNQPEKAKEIIKLVEGAVNLYYWGVEIKNAGTAGQVIVALNPLKKSAEDLFSELQNMDNYSLLNFFNHSRADTIGPEGGHCGFNSKRFSIFSLELEALISALDKAIKSFERFKTGRSKDKAKHILLMLFRIFEKYRPGITWGDQVALAETILEEASIPCPEIDHNRTRFQNWLKSFH